MLQSLLGPGMAFFEKSKWFRELGLDTSTVKRLVLIECRKNLAMSEPLELSDKDVPQDASAIIAVARCLQYDALEALLAMDDKSRKAIEQLWRIPLMRGTAESNTEIQEQPSVESISVGERIVRLYVRMYSVRMFAEIWSLNANLTGVRKVYFKTRMRNIREALLALESALVDE